MTGGTLAARDLACVRGGRLVFTGLGFELPAGGALVLVGPNGTGKSTLLRLLAGLGRPFAGALTWDGEPIADDPDAHRRRMVYGGHADGVKAPLTVHANLAFWADLSSTPRDRIGPALGSFGLEPLADLPARFLSAGQKRRLGLARLALSTGPLWLLDEPTVALDVASIARLEMLLAGHRARGGSVVLATHAPIDLPEAERLDLGTVAVDPLAGRLFGEDAA